MRPIFLTGETGAGKSTLIDRVLMSHPDWRAGGFRTFTAELPGALGGVYIAPGDMAPADAPRDALHLVGIRHEIGRPEAFPAVFDALGPGLLSCVGIDLLLMDELGFMENDAFAFQAAVWRALHGDAPVLGVLKPRSTPFLDAVRARAHVICVTAENREALLTELDDVVSREVGLWRRMGGAGKRG